MPVLKVPSHFVILKMQQNDILGHGLWGENITGLESPFFLVFISIISGKKHLISLSLNFKIIKWLH